MKESRPSPTVVVSYPGEIRFRFHWSAPLLVLLMLPALFFLYPSAGRGDVPIVLFDNAHAQTAGNADWTIYGGYSDMGDAVRFLGCRVQSQDGGLLNERRLSDVDVLISPEPNRAFRKDEMAAIVAFVRRGGGFFLITDHARSDRNNDGVDSVDIANDFTRYFGIKVEYKWFSLAPIKCTRKHFITDGVIQVGQWGGAGILCVSSRAKVVISHKKGVYLATAEVGKGRVVVLVDSSPFDDGSGAPGDKLYDGWNNPSFNHERLALNCVRWLLKQDVNPVDESARFSELLDSLDRAGRKRMAGRLDRAIGKHKRTISKCRIKAVKRTWREDLERLLKLRQMVADYGRRTRFNLLYADLELP